MNFDKYNSELFFYASDILNSNGMDMEKGFVQHGTTSVFVHSCMVAKFCLSFVDRFNLTVDRRALVRGALLHDYFLYDWHDNDKTHRLHGFTHGKTAAFNARRDFNVGDMEYDMILCHMFPLTFRIPKYREGIVLTIADKVCASYEILDGLFAWARKFVYSNWVYLRFDVLIICFMLIKR